MGALNGKYRRPKLLLFVLLIAGDSFLVVVDVVGRRNRPHDDTNITRASDFTLSRDGLRLSNLPKLRCATKKKRFSLLTNTLILTASGWSPIHFGCCRHAQLTLLSSARRYVVKKIPFATIIFCSLLHPLCHHRFLGFFFIKNFIVIIFSGSSTVALRWQPPGVRYATETLFLTVCFDVI